MNPDENCWIPLSRLIDLWICLTPKTRFLELVEWIGHIYMIYIYGKMVSWCFLYRFYMVLYTVPTGSYCLDLFCAIAIAPNPMRRCWWLRTPMCRSTRGFGVSMRPGSREAVGMCGQVKVLKAPCGFRMFSSGEHMFLGDFYETDRKIYWGLKSKTIIFQ